jgi:hypothetical protein
MLEVKGGSEGPFLVIEGGGGAVGSPWLKEVVVDTACRRTAGGKGALADGEEGQEPLTGCQDHGLHVLDDLMQSLGCQRRPWSRKVPAKAHERLSPSSHHDGSGVYVI